MHLGANACIVGRNAEKAERVAKSIATARPGAKVLGIGNVDVRKAETLQSAAERCVEELGGIDFVIAGAAGNFLAPVTQLSANAFKTVIDIDVLGSYNAVKVCLPHVIESAKKHKVDGVTGGEDSLPRLAFAKRASASASGTGGRIIFVGGSFYQTGAQLQTHVNVAKTGINALSANLAIELGPLGVTSNVIAPGPIGNTEGMDILTPKADKEDHSRIPLGRQGSVKDVSDATVYLLGDAGNYVNGDVLLVDGGAWHVPGSAPGSTIPYPGFLLSGEAVGAPRGGNAGAKRGGKPADGKSKL